MTSTTDTTFHRQYSLALQALGLHMEAHDLPAPAAIDTVEHHYFEDRPPAYSIRLRLPALYEQQKAWIDSVAVDHQNAYQVELGFRVHWDVRLPDTGFRFELVGLRPTPIVRPVSA